MGRRLGASALLPCSLALIVHRSAARQHAGVASGVLNAARQAGGALGVALLGSLLTGAGHGLALQVPLSVAAASLVAAVGLAWTATRPGRMG